MINPNDFAQKVKQVENLSKKVYQLEQERDELAAHCEYIKEKAKLYMGCPSDHKALFELKDVLEQTPQQSLAEIEANAVESAFYSYACEKHGVFEAENSEEYEYGKEYANQLREQVK